MMNLGARRWGDADWIGLTRDRDMWRALVNVVMNLGFHKMLGNYQVATQLTAFQVVLSCIKILLLLLLLLLLFIFHP
jgi:hypothetical protein